MADGGKNKGLILNCCTKVTDEINSNECVESAAEVPSHISEFRRSILNDFTIIHCSVHDGKLFELYCETCGELVCSQCVVQGQRHSTHRYDLISVAYERFKDEIEAALKPMEVKLASINRALSNIATCSSEVTDRQVAVESFIESTTKRLHDMIDVRKMELASQLREISHDKIVGLRVQKDRLEIIQTRLSHSLDIMGESLRIGSHREVVMMKETVMKHVDELTTAIDPETLEPCTQANMEFSISPDISKACQRYGEIILEKSLDPSKFYLLEGDNLELTTVGERSTVTLKTDHYNGELRKEHLQLVRCELVSVLTDAKTSGDVDTTQRKCCSITYKPIVKGKHHLNVKFDGRHITGSPFIIHATLPIEKLGSPIGVVDDVHEPINIAITPSGDLVIVERERHHILVYSPDNKTRRFINSKGEFSESHGIAVDSEGNIIVGDSNNHQIQKFTPEGQFLMAVGSEGTGPLKFTSHRGIACNLTNRKIYIVDENHIQILNSDFTHCDTFGKEGYGKGEFNCPRGIACDSVGRVYVADSQNHRIQVFTAEGKYLKAFGKFGEGRGDIKTPIGVAVDRNDMVYVSHSDRISVFTAEGWFMTMLGKKGEELGELV